MLGGSPWRRAGAIGLKDMTDLICQTLKNPSRWAPDERRRAVLVVCRLGGAEESEVCWLVGGQGFGVSNGSEIVNE